MNEGLLKVALLGNPNCGKTTLFNHLTGKQQQVGNWSGVTVEKKLGYLKEKNKILEVIDLPGCYHYYSSSSALDEQITHQFLLNEKAFIVNVVDATNLERHLYLTLELLERKKPMLVALNMMDAAKAQGLEINIEMLSKQLGCKVLPLSALKAQGIEHLIQEIFFHANNFSYSIQELDKEDECPIDEGVTRAAARYERIQHILQASIKKDKEKKLISWTEIIDGFILNRFLGIPLFLAAMYLVFIFAIHIGGTFQDFFDIASRSIFMEGSRKWLFSIKAPEWLIVLTSQGVGQGINTTVSFIPVIAGMFFSLSFLEASGYMARAAFVMDRMMQWIGLPGKSFVPMVIGFGCNVPAVMAARTLENYRERIITILMSPFMSCGARLAIYALFVSAFFPHRGQNIIFGLYIIGIFIALLTGFILRKTILQGEHSNLLIELPPYRWPSLKTLMRTTWHRLVRFIMKAGALIVPLCVAISLFGVLQNRLGIENWLSIFGKKITPIFSPMGIKEDNWPATVGLLSGVLAKEVVVGTLNALYEQDRDIPKAYASQKGLISVTLGLKEAVKSIVNNWSELGQNLMGPLYASTPNPLNEGTIGVMVTRFGSSAAAFSYLLFVLLYFPCVSVVVTIARELNKYWAIFVVLWTTGIAYASAVLFYQIAFFMEHPWTSLTWIFAIAACMLSGVWGLRYCVKLKVPVKSVKSFPTRILIVDN